MSTKCSFKKVTSTKLDLLKGKHLKQRTLSKVKWAVRAYQEWRACCLQDPDNYDQLVFDVNLSDLNNLKKEALSHV